MEQFPKISIMSVDRLNNLSNGLKMAPSKEDNDTSGAIGEMNLLIPKQELLDDDELLNQINELEREIETSSMIPKIEPQTESIQPKIEANDGAILPKIENKPETDLTLLNEHAFLDNLMDDDYLEPINSHVTDIEESNIETIIASNNFSANVKEEPHNEDDEKFLQELEYLENNLDPCLFAPNFRAEQNNDNILKKEVEVELAIAHSNHAEQIKEDDNTALMFKKKLSTKEKEAMTRVEKFGNWLQYSYPSYRNWMAKNHNKFENYLCKFDSPKQSTWDKWPTKRWKLKFKKTLIKPEESKDLRIADNCPVLWKLVQTGEKLDIELDPTIPPFIKQAVQLIEEFCNTSTAVQKEASRHDIIKAHKVEFIEVFLRSNCKDEVLLLMTGVNITDEMSKQLIQFFSPIVKANTFNIKSVHMRSQQLRTSKKQSRTIRICGTPCIKEDIGPIQMELTPWTSLYSNVGGIECIAKTVYEFLQPCGEGTLLFIGCATGLVNLILADKFPKVIGIDLETEIKEAKETQKYNNIKNAEFVDYSSNNVEDVFYKLQNLKRIFVVLCITRLPKKSVELVLNLREQHNLQHVILITELSNERERVLMELFGPGPEDRGDPFIPIRGCVLDTAPDKDHFQILFLMERRRVKRTVKEEMDSENLANLSSNRCASSTPAIFKDPELLDRRYRELPEFRDSSYSRATESGRYREREVQEHCYRDDQLSESRSMTRSRLPEPRSSRDREMLHSHYRESHSSDSRNRNRVEYSNLPVLYAQESVDPRHRESRNSISSRVPESSYYREPELLDPRYREMNVSEFRNLTRNRAPETPFCQEPGRQERQLYRAINSSEPENRDPRIREQPSVVFTSPQIKPRFISHENQAFKNEAENGAIEEVTAAEKILKMVTSTVENANMDPAQAQTIKLMLGQALEHSSNVKGKLLNIDSRQKSPSPPPLPPSLPWKINFMPDSGKSRYENIWPAEPNLVALRTKPKITLDMKLQKQQASAVPNEEAILTVKKTSNREVIEKSSSTRAYKSTSMDPHLRKEKEKNAETSSRKSSSIDVSSRKEKAAETQSRRSSSKDVSTHEKKDESAEKRKLSWDEFHKRHKKKETHSEHSKKNRRTSPSKAKAPDQSSSKSKSSTRDKSSSRSKSSSKQSSSSTRKHSDSKNLSNSGAESQSSRLDKRIKVESIISSLEDDRILVPMDFSDDDNNDNDKEVKTEPMDFSIAQHSSFFDNPAQFKDFNNFGFPGINPPLPKARPPSPPPLPTLPSSPSSRRSGPITLRPTESKSKYGNILPG